MYNDNYYKNLTDYVKNDLLEITKKNKELLINKEKILFN